MAKPWDRACATRGSGHMSLKTAVSLSVVVAPLTSQAWILSPVIPQHDHSRRGTSWAQCVGLPTRVLPTLAPSLPATTSEGRRSMACRSSTIGGSTTGKPKSLFCGTFPTGLADIRLMGRYHALDCNWSAALKIRPRSLLSVRLDQCTNTVFIFPKRDSPVTSVGSVSSFHIPSA